MITSIVGEKGEIWSGLKVQRSRSYREGQRVTWQPEKQKIVAAFGKKRKKYKMYICIL